MPLKQTSESLPFQRVEPSYNLRLFWKGREHLSVLAAVSTGLARH
jgi:hypothetical protein